MTITCNHCGAVRYVSECRGHLKFCSVACYLDSIKLDFDTVERLADRGYSRRMAAESLGIPYPTFYRKLVKQEFNWLFLGRGKYHAGSDGL